MARKKAPLLVRDNESRLLVRVVEACKAAWREQDIAHEEVQRVLDYAAQRYGIPRKP